MNKKIFLFTIVFLFFSVGVWYWSTQNENNKNINNNKNEAKKEVSQVEKQINENAEIILFYGDRCPHCKDVEKFIEENSVDEKVEFENLEVWSNKKNADLFLKKAQECNVSKDMLGVPFLYARGKCMIGSPEIEKFFKKEADL